MSTLTRPIAVALIAVVPLAPAGTCATADDGAVTLPPSAVITDSTALP